MKNGFEVTLAANFKTDEDINSQEKINNFIMEMKQMDIQVVQIDFTRRIADIHRQIKSLHQVKRLLAKRFDLVHCHSPICAALTRLVFEKYRKIYGSKIIYTAHGFHFFHGAPLKNWILYYPVEMLLSYWTDVLITINHEDYQRAKKKFHAKKVIYIPGIGIDTEKFGVLQTKKEDKRKELKLNANDTVLISAGKLNEDVPYDLVIKAFARLKYKFRENFSKYHYFICGQGNRIDYLQNLIHELKMDKQVHLLGHRDDIDDILNCADAFFFVQKNKEIPLSLIEAMASGIPCAGSGNLSLLRNGIEGIITGYDEEEIARCLEKILDNSKEGNIMKVNAWYRIKGVHIPMVPEQLQSVYDQASMEGFRRVMMLLDRYCMRMRLGIPQQAFVILSVGELNDNKNHKAIINAVRELNDGDIYYIICGKGKNQLFYENLIKENRLENQVKMTGYQSDVRPFLACADIFAFPSQREGLGMAALEAMSAGLPILTSYVGGIKDYSKNGITGYTIHNANDSSAFADAIRRLKKNRRSFYKMSKENEKAVLNFSVVKVNQIMAELYNDCLCLAEKGTK